jgi:hypothetical protein
MASSPFSLSRALPPRLNVALQGGRRDDPNLRCQRRLGRHSAPPAPHGWLSVALTFSALFAIGALRSLVTVRRWWAAGLEMLLLGAAVAVAAYGSGAIIASILAAP